ncbi:MAG: fibronectin/fibrinogen-binding protein [Clostridiales bacterium]|nr:fibronectin/fibrinogen-binding protein [Clostridiales bacterium]
MPQDAYTLRYLCEELNSIFSGGKINRITQPSFDELVLTVYTGKGTEKLLLNVNPSSPRIGIISREKDSPLTAPNFCMLMRKHLLSATILSMELVGFDRIIKIDLMASGEFFDAVKKTVYIELMGRYSNIILTENGKVLGGNRGINMFDDGVRPLIVGKDYVFPPVGQKRLPQDTNLIEIFNGCTNEQLSQTIVQNVQGIAQSTATEIASKYFAKSGEGESDGKAFFQYLNEYLYSKQYSPCVISENGQIKDVCVYPYECVSGQVLPFDKLYKAEEYYFENKEKYKNYVNKKERLNSIVNTLLKKVKKKLTAIKAKEKDADSCEENRIKGELILSNIYKIKQGDKECVVDNYYDGGQMKITLNEYLSPSKNAENYYKKYNKQKRTLVALKPQREQAESEQNYLLSVLDEISLSEDIKELQFIEKDLINAGVIAENKKVNPKKEQESLYRNYKFENFVVRVGRNNIENDKLTFTAKPNDIWLHAKEYHSSHAIIQTNGQKVPESVIVFGAEICAYYSKGRDGGKTEIVYTEKKNVKKPSKAKAGFVIYENFKSIMVKPNKHQQELIEK